MNEGKNGIQAVASPRPWRYVVGAAITFPIVFLVWLVFDFRVLHPELANVEVESTMDRIRWVAVPLLLVVALFGGKWLYDLHQAKERALQRKQAEQHLTEQQGVPNQSPKARREYVIEVLGLGVTVEKYRQGKLWNILQQGNAYASIREPDPEKYPWTNFDKAGVTGSRSSDALENGAEPSPMFWGVPSMYAGGPYENTSEKLSDTWPMAGLASSAEGTGMAWHLFVTGPWELSERPDKLLDQVFAFFDEHPDLPYLVLLAADDDARRDASRAPGQPKRVKTGYYIPEYSDASAVFVLARRERVEPLRPYVWDDPDNDYLQENLRRMYYEVKRTVSAPQKLANPDGVHYERQPTVAEWLRFAAEFAKRPVYDKKDGSLTDVFKRWVNHPPKDWKPTPWFPVPWNREQMKAFDNLPSLGFIHRPVFVKYEDEHGQPVKRRDARQKILEEGWRQALETLSDAEREKGPARVIAAYGKNVEQQIAFEGVLHKYAAQGGPEIDSGKTAQFINTDHRMGNTGAATFFVQMAVGVMGSYLDGGPSAAINLRDPSGASIVFISPPKTERLKVQEGLDVFKHRVQPSIDPENYKPPTVGEVLGVEPKPVAKATAATHQ